MVTSSFARKAFRAVAVAAVLGTTAFAPAASAAPSEANEVWMFSDPGLTNHVGTRWINCYNPYIVQEGTMTPYRMLIWSEPCEPWHP